MIKISKENKKDLDEMKEYERETYDDIITKLIKQSYQLKE